jgi:hypothetical protein
MNNKNTTKTSLDNEKSDALLGMIADAIFWSQFDDKQKSEILTILKDCELSNRSKANEICEYLGIEKRFNRSAIYTVLDNQPTLAEPVK